MTVENRTDIEDEVADVMTRAKFMHMLLDWMMTDSKSRLESLQMRGVASCEEFGFLS